MTGRRRLARPERRRFIVIELTIWLAGVERRTTWGRWVVRSSGKPKAHSRGRGHSDAEAKP